MDEWLYPFRPAISPASVVQFPHPEHWTPTDEGFARLPLLFSIDGKLLAHPTIAHLPATGAEANHMVSRKAASLTSCLHGLYRAFANLPRGGVEEDTVR